MQKTYILGEIHGSINNIEAIKRLIKALEIKHVLFELPSDWNILLSKNNLDLKELIGKLSLLKDGRVGLKHIELFQQLYHSGINISFVDVAETDWNTEYENRDEIIATNFVNYLKQNTKGNTLIILGRIHARSRCFKMNKQKYIPAGYLIRNKIKNSIHIEVKYTGGSIYNFKIKKLPAVKNTASEFNLTKSHSIYFDYECWVGESKPLDII